MARTHRETTQKGVNNLNNLNGVITHLEESDIVKWALGSLTIDTASEGYGIPAELFQILR